MGKTPRQQTIWRAKIAFFKYIEERKKLPFQLFFYAALKKLPMLAKTSAILKYWL